MSQLIDLTGKKFGKLTVMKRAENSRTGKTKWECLCDCGNKIMIVANSLIHGHSKSCGCLRGEIASVTNRKHGLKDNGIYKLWKSIKKRCYTKSTTGFKNYGGRGITMCSEWEHNPEIFVKWALSNGYQKGLQIDRIDNNGNYCPENCRFVTAQENSNNRRSNRYDVIFGEKLTYINIMRKYHIPSTTFYRWRHKGIYGKLLENAIISRKCCSGGGR